MNGIRNSNLTFNKDEKLFNDVFIDFQNFKLLTRLQCYLKITSNIMIALDTFHDLT